jgi:hypothetical protein
MTVICVKVGTMAADSHVFTSGTHWEGAFPKITRGPKGLIGVAGPCTDCYLISQWWKNGGEGEIPGLLQGREGAAALILLNDGSLWFMDERLKPYPTSEPAVTGQPDASTFCEGAMLAGASAEEAVRLAIKHTTSAGGEVQVERLEQPVG